MSPGSLDEGTEALERAALVPSVGKLVTASDASASPARVGNDVSESSGLPQSGQKRLSFSSSLEQEGQRTMGTYTTPPPDSLRGKQAGIEISCGLIDARKDLAV